MRRFCINCLVFLAIVAVCDFVLGRGLEYWRANKSKGNVGNLEYTYRRSNDDVIVYGASRATNHYVSQIISDSLGMSCYNCGRNGMGILYVYGRWKMLKSHHIPKLILYDITSNDYREDTYSRYIRDLRPYYGCEGMDELFNDIDSLERFKLTSLLYRQNSQLLDIFVGDKMAPGMVKGYVPLHGTIGENYLKTDSTYTISDLKMKYMEKFIQETQQEHVRLIFFISPYYVSHFSTFPDELVALFKKYHVPYFDNSSLDGFTGNSNLFVITKHLNDEGAKAYTRRVIPQIRSVIERKAAR